MASTAVSSFFPYNAPTTTRPCGEVFCSRNFENFSIKCSKCYQEFNLLSYTLFIKHIKECLTQSLPDLDMPIKEIISIKNDNITFDPFPTVYPDLLNSADVNATNENTAAIASTNDVVDNTLTPLFDPIITFKQEPIKEDPAEEYNSGYESVHEDGESQSDYQNEDDLSIDKLGYRRVTEGIIAEYKRNEILWRVPEGTKGRRKAMKNVYKRISKAINSKFRTNFTDRELRNRIYNIKFAYRRVLKRKQEFEARNAGTGKEFTSALWYFDKMSFLDNAEMIVVDEIDPILDSLNRTETNADDSTDEDEDGSGDDSDDSYDSDEKAVKPKASKAKEKKQRPYHKNLSEQKTVADLLNQYKQYPYLWDQTADLYSDKYARKAAFRKITKYINKTYNKSVTDKEVRQQIVNLRSGYRRAQRKMHKPKHRVSLWYYNLISFIDKKPLLESPFEFQAVPKTDCLTGKQVRTVLPGSGQPEEMTQIIPKTELDTSKENNAADDGEDSKDETEEQSCRSGSDKLLITGLIEEYKRHPCLWDNDQYRISNRVLRQNAVKEMTETLNAKFKRTFTDDDIRNKIIQLRSTYRRVLRHKEAFEKKHADTKMKFHPQLWYFDKFQFIGAKDSDFSVARKRKRKDYVESSHEDEDMESQSKKVCEEPEDESTMSFEDDDDESFSDFSLMGETESEKTGDENVKSKKSNPFSKNKELLTALIEEYKKLPCLWSAKHYVLDCHARKRAFHKMAMILNERFNTDYDASKLKREIQKMRSSYRRRKNRIKQDPESKTVAWYMDLLSFIDNENSDDIANGGDSLPVDGGLDDEKTRERTFKLASVENVSDIIEAYKAAPILWDNNHPRRRFRSERKKCLQDITAALSEKHDRQITIEEFRYQIRFLREAYSRAVMLKSKYGSVSEINLPFFYDQMSFLEPFVKKYTPTPPISVPECKPDEDFKYLTENKDLMISFIEMYKKQHCLWDQKHKLRHSEVAHTNAYGRLMKLFADSGVVATKEQVMSAIGFLNKTVLDTKKLLESYDTNTAITEEPVWFYEHLKFIGKIPRINKNCTHCDQQFRSLREYEKHKIEITGDYPYKCTVCNAGFVSRSKFAYHMITHKQPLKCDQCDFQAFDKHNFNVHMRRHKRILSYRCPECDKGFVTTTELRRHEQLHSGQKRFICDICGKFLATNSEFLNHMKRHTNQRDHKCEICGSAFYTHKALRDHLASHSDERRHVCETCGASFKRQKTLYQHKSLHNAQKKHECKICSKAFAQKAGLYSHMKSHGLMTGNQ